MATKSAGSLEAGPNVATILVARVAIEEISVGRCGPTQRGWPVIQFHIVTEYSYQRVTKLVRSSRQNLKSGEGFAFQDHQESATTRRDVADLIGHVVLGDGSERVAATRDTEGIAFRNGLCQGFGAVFKGLELKNTNGAIPNNRTCLLCHRRVFRRRDA